MSMHCEQVGRWYVLSMGNSSSVCRGRRRGMTLLELVVVMGILVGLAAILVPLMPNMLRRAHKATDATQSGELAKAIQTCQAATYSYPDRWDSLTDKEWESPGVFAGLGNTRGVFGGFVNSRPPTTGAG